jgi:hypothetical protein
MWLLNLIPARIQYYLILAGVLIAGIFGIYWIGGRDKKRELEIEINKKLIRDLKVAKEVKDEIEAMGGKSLRDRASRWVRHDDK